MDNQFFTNFQTQVSQNKPNNAKNTKSSGFSYIWLGLVIFAIYPPLLIVGILLFVLFAVLKTANKKSTDSTFRSSDSISEGHLCEDNQHTEENQDGKIALNNMEEGYRTFKRDAFSPSDKYSYVQSQSDYASLRERKLTREEFRKKQEELHSLLSAGIISNSEYSTKIKEYSSYTR